MAAAFAAVGASGCDGDLRCGGEAPCSIVIQVDLRDDEGRELAEMASGYVRDGAYVDSLRSINGLSLGAALCRRGVYDIHVESDGYSDWDTTGVVAQVGECSIAPRRLEVELTPVVSESSNAP
jgi:hypothetical protein